MKSVFKVLGIVVIVFILVAAGGIFYMTLGLEEGQDISIDGVNKEGLSEGIFVGEYKFGRWSNRIQVTIDNGKIVDLKILDDVTFVSEEVSEELFTRVIEKQNTDVDVVSGATVTSKAYLKAIENAVSGNKMEVIK